MKIPPTLLFIALFLFGLSARANDASLLTRAITEPDLVFEEIDGFVAVEAEHFQSQAKNDVRAWYRTSANESANLQPDADPNHSKEASGGVYLEALPDTRKNHSEKLIPGENFSNEPGKIAILSYRVHFNTPGKYYVWVRTHSTGTEDNGLHVGIDHTWPESGQRMQWTAKKRWAWGSKQRTKEVHGGVPGILFIEVPTAGEHVIQFSMREDGFEFDQWLMTMNPDFKAPNGSAGISKCKVGQPPSTAPVAAIAKPEPRGEDGDGAVEVRGELKQWHKVTMTMNGPFAHELDQKPNPFTDYGFSISLTHESGEKVTVPGYFAADGNAGETSAKSGNQWRAHFAPDKTGLWNFRVHFVGGMHAAIQPLENARAIAPFDGVSGSFSVLASDKKGRDLRGKGRLSYVGKRLLQFEGSGEYFLKSGADAPETFLGYHDFDGTTAGKPDKVPLKTWAPHLQDWNAGDPTWKGGKGKGMIGAINYLSGKGCNVFSFLTYNAGGDGDNIWPFVERDAKFHYDCSKLDQWGMVFDHGTAKGMYLHFKLQETENDDLNRGHKNSKSSDVPTALDRGELGPERKLYLREIIARFGHNLALNWNLGEENTQTTKQQQEMAQYIADTDPYDHLIVIHTYPNQQDKIYPPLMGNGSALRGASLQNSNVQDCHQQVVKWTRASAAAGKAWVIAFDEPGNATEGMPPDPGYPGMPDDFTNPSIHDVRKYALWGTLLGGGGGVEYYFGYKLPQNDLICEDWRSRDRSWDFCRIALEFFSSRDLPLAEMWNEDELVGNPKHDNSAYCLAKREKAYLVYLPNGGERELDLTDAKGSYTIGWFNPREGGELVPGRDIEGGQVVSLVAPEGKDDWLALLEAKPAK